MLSPIEQAAAGRRDRRRRVLHAVHAMSWIVVLSIFFRLRAARVCAWIANELSWLLSLESDQRERLISWLVSPWLRSTLRTFERYQRTQPPQTPPNPETTPE